MSFALPPQMHVQLVRPNSVLAVGLPYIAMSGATAMRAPS